MLPFGSGEESIILPFASGITGTYVEIGHYLILELKSLRSLQVVQLATKDKTVISTIKSGFSPILEDYLGEYLHDFNNTFLEMQSHPMPVDGEEREINITSNTKMKFCWIPAGKAMLGSPENEKGRGYHEARHEFETNGFWMGKYPVTQAQWKSVMGNNPSIFEGDNHPVEMVSWYDCQDFIKQCSVVGLKPQLPHEDQWEYACRGGKGNKQAFYWGDTLNGDKANCDGTVPYGTDEQGIYLAKTTEVGSYEKAAPHPWNLCDMSGNVWEWCDNLYSNGLCWMVRGGCFGNDSEYSRSSFRNWFFPTVRYGTLGFRLSIY